MFQPMLSLLHLALYPSQVRVSPHNSNCWMKAWCVVAPRLFSQPFGSPAKALSPELLCFGSQGDCCPQFRALLDGCQVMQEEGPDALGAVVSCLCSRLERSVDT